MAVLLGLPPGIDIPDLFIGKGAVLLSLNPTLGFIKPDRLARSRRVRCKHGLYSAEARAGAKAGACPPWQWSVAWHVDRILESSSRPPSSPAFFGWTRKVYSGRREADLVMSSAIDTVPLHSVRWSRP
jgi:hypothetical protein